MQRHYKMFGSAGTAALCLSLAMSVFPARLAAQTAPSTTAGYVIPHIPGAPVGATETYHYQENWASLEHHIAAPKWFEDAKFGIYTHFGPTAVGNIGMNNPAGWYGMEMYMKEQYDWETGKPILDPKTGKPVGPSEAYLHHLKTYGDPHKVGYTAVIQQFKPTRFNAAEWASLFADAGAKFAGPVGIHSDNFAMWDSQVTRWNVKAFTGVDVAGELKPEIEKRGMKFMMSFHHDFSWVFFANAWNFDATPATADLYTDKHAITDMTPDARFRAEWFAKLKEAVDKYQPDFVWLDWWTEFLPAADRKKFLAYYFNKGEDWNKDVVVSFKNTSFPPETGVNDYERGRPDTLKDKFWMTDTSPGEWFFAQHAKFEDTNTIVDILIDIVSKNGLMLLDVPPNPDGSIPPEMQTLLHGIGAWLKINGEGIYGTRPLGIYGEGPTRLAGGGHKVESSKTVYTQDDIRFTHKGDDTVFAFVMDKPTHDIRIGSMGSRMTLLPGKIKGITMLGSPQQVVWQQTPDALVIKAPSSVLSDIAVGYKIMLDVPAEQGIGGAQAEAPGA